MSCRSSSTSHSSSKSEQNFPAPASLSALKKLTRSLCEKPVYAYIVTTIKTHPNFQLQQEGSAPNFDGGRITLCTCKHKDRATFCPVKKQKDPWQNVWVAGLTSKKGNRPRSLVYLMCVERSFSTQRELWEELNPKCRRAKSASKFKHGDLYEPKASAKNALHNPADYCSPIRGHSHSSKEEPNKWHEDIKRWGKHSKPHPLLLGQMSQSYRWTKVKIILKENAIGTTAHHKMYKSLNEFIENLQEFNP